jgi:hypothetical protein
VEYTSDILAVSQSRSRRAESVTVSSSLKLNLYANVANFTTYTTVSINGTDQTASMSLVYSTGTNSGVWEVTGFTGTLSSIGLGAQNGASNGISRVIVDDFTLLNGAGDNSFRLNFSDTSTNQALGFDSSVTVSDPDPALGMDVVTYTGNGTTQNISGYNFEPGLVWVKQFNTSRDHCWCDIVRGPDKRLRSNTSDAQTDESVVTGFDPSGFTVGSDNGVNQSAGTYVAWAWKAGGLPVTNTDGSTSAQVSANDTHGFSICQYEGTGTLATIGHGLSTAPKFMIVRNIDAVANWNVYHTSLGATKRTRLDQDSASQTSAGFWNDTDPTSSVFTVNTDNDVNASNQTIIAYVWSEITGYSKFGSYTGNGTSTGPVVEVGFETRWIMIKRAEDVGNWIVYDTVRDGRIDNTKRLYANTGSAEVDSSGYRLDITATTFQPLSANDNFNAASEYIYVAFANRPGNNWTVNNILTDAGLTTSQQNFDVVTYTGNGSEQRIGNYKPSQNATVVGGTVSNPEYAFDGSGANWATLAATTTSTAASVDFAVNLTGITRIEAAFDSPSGSGDTRGRYNGANGGASRTGTGSGYSDIYNGSAITVTSVGFAVNQNGATGTSSDIVSRFRITDSAGTRFILDGDGSNIQFRPDFVWYKHRDGASNHGLFDSVRGATRYLASSNTNAESAVSGVTQFDNNNGFYLGSDSGGNGSGS